MATLKIEGIAKLNKGLKKRMDMGAVQTVVRKNGADMQAKSQRNAPVDTGTLKRSIGIDISDGWDDCDCGTYCGVCALCRTRNPVHGSAALFKARLRGTEKTV